MKHVRLIVLDMDGTLLLSDHQTVPQRNIDAIRRANAAGIHVCICTGRMLEDASDFTHRLNLPCMLIACKERESAMRRFLKAGSFTNVRLSRKTQSGRSIFCFRIIL